MKFVIFSDEEGTRSPSPNEHTLAECLGPHRLSKTQPVIFVGIRGVSEADNAEDADIAIVWDPGSKASAYSKPSMATISNDLRRFLKRSDTCQPLIHNGSEYIHNAQIRLVEGIGAACRRPVSYRHSSETFDLVCRLLVAAGDPDRFRATLERLERSVEPPVAITDFLLRDAYQEGADSAGERDRSAVIGAPAATPSRERDSCAPVLPQAFRDWRHGLKGAQAQIVGGAKRLAGGASEQTRMDSLDSLAELPADALSRHRRALDTLLTRCGEASPAASVAAAAVEESFSSADLSWRTTSAEAAAGRGANPERLRALLQETLKALFQLDERIDEICHSLQSEPVAIVPAARGVRH